MITFKFYNQIRNYDDSYCSNFCWADLSVLVAYTLTLL